jgi:hypothetical protein
MGEPVMVAPGVAQISASLFAPFDISLTLTGSLSASIIPIRASNGSRFSPCNAPANRTLETGQAEVGVSGARNVLLKISM